MSQELAKQENQGHAQILEEVVTKGDLADLSPLDESEIDSIPGAKRIETSLEES